MIRKINFILGIFILTQSSFAQAHEDENSSLFGIAAFCTTIACTKLAQNYHKQKKSQALPTIDPASSEKTLQQKATPLSLRIKSGSKDDMSYKSSQEKNSIQSKFQPKSRSKTTDDISKSNSQTPIITPLDDELNNKIIQIHQQKAMDDFFRKKTTPIVPKITYEKFPIRIEKRLFGSLLATYNEGQAKLDKQHVIQKIDRLYRKNDHEGINTLVSHHILPFDDQRGKKDGRTSTKHTFHPTGSIPQKVIFLKSVHGTWGNPSSYGENTDKPMSRSFLAYAQRLALEQNAIVYLDVIKWDGTLSKTARKQAGENLAIELITELQEIQETHPDKKVFIQTIGHSHGCNVINYAAEELKKEGINVDEAIFFGSPISDIEPTNIKNILNIFGKLDFTGSMGSWLSTAGTSTEMRKDGSHVKNIALQHEGKDLNHTSIKYIGMAFLPMIQKFTQENYTEQNHLIVDIYDEKKYTNQSTFNEDDLEEITHETAVQALPNYQVTGFIDELHAKDGFDFDAHNNDSSELHASNETRKEYLKRYETHSSIYRDPNMVERFISEGESAGIPSWILQTLQTTQKTSQATTDYLSSLQIWLRQQLTSNQPSQEQDEYYNIDAIIASSKIKIEKESRSKEKSLLIAQTYGDIILAACDNGLDVELTQQKLNDSLRTMNDQIGKWQWIIGKTRTSDNGSWTPQEKEQLVNAQEIYKKLHLYQGQELSEMLSGYENLDDNAQQALTSAIEQGLKITNIEEITSEYMKKYTRTQTSTSGTSSPK
ncbi:hypothetical protein KBC04_02290 [Candidatus Babeliales bacterium]|nr:hypothetical protein [Candidatus Babeliales bacterium]MBP9843761.1 hypothetical protein [Candidatus Babeliales bacterium]